MFEIAVSISVISSIIAIFGGLPTLFIYRIVYTLIKRFDFKKTLMILFIPLSYGFYLYADDKFKKIYSIIVYLFFAFALLGSFIVIYLRLPNTL